MHPTLVREPSHRDGWVFEEKYDGWRYVAACARIHAGPRARASPRRAGPAGSRGASTPAPHRHVGHTAECLLCAFDASSPPAAAAEWVWTWLGAPDGSCAFALPPSRRGSSVVPK